MYRLKIAATDQVSFGPVPLLMVVKFMWSTFTLCLKMLKATLTLFILMDIFPYDMLSMEFSIL